MVYTETQLKDLIRPMVLSTILAEGDSDTKAEFLTNGIVKLILQDREAYRAKT